MSNTGKRGDVHPITGKIFWKRDKGAKDGVWWVTPEKYQKMKGIQKAQNERWYEENNDHHRKKTAAWHQNNKEKLRAYHQRPLVKESRRIRNLLNRSVRRNQFTPELEEIIGCDIETFKHHVEDKFQRNMSWGNYGEWHFDHIRPFSRARTMAEILEIAHYSNVQPLWAKDNRKKHNL